MAKKFHQPIRMCISCRKREYQKDLKRFLCKKGKIEPFLKEGRSFYLCHECLEVDKKLKKALMRICKSANKDKLLNKLKEIITDER